MAEAQDELGLGLSSGFKFAPEDEELVEYYLLRQILNEQLPLEAVILEDDPLSAPPWELLDKHKRADEAFFFADGQTKHGTGGRQKRTCAGGGWWAGQQVVVGGDTLHVPDIGTEITWRKYMLNFHLDDNDGSTGWVKHEYSITAPAHLASSSLRLYRVRFSGHGQNCKREPDDYSIKKQLRADKPDLPDEEEHIVCAASSVFPAVAEVDLVDDEDGGSARPPATSYSDLEYRYPGWTTQVDSLQDLAVPDSLFFPGADVGDYAGPNSDPYFLGGNTMNLGEHNATTSSDQGAPCEAMDEYYGAPPAAGMLPFAQGSFSGALDELFVDFELPDMDFSGGVDEPFMDFELSDMDFNIDGSSEAPLHGH